ncbi:MAG: hypothetical protein OXH90_01725 [Paracoccaceae bacterium]|nr:hypothetical protein [Paracoccaceae bacterium]MDE2916078.1 hypothetical protein [Paracoccaceae bacterium]
MSIATNLIALASSRDLSPEVFRVCLWKVSIWNGQSLHQNQEGVDVYVFSDGSSIIDGALRNGNFYAYDENSR